MKTIDPFAQGTDDGDQRVVSDDRRHAHRYTYSAARVLVGPCPECATPLVVFNDGESWPLVGCACGWSGGTREFTSVRVERDPGVRAHGDTGPPSMQLRVVGEGDIVFNTRTPQGNITRDTPTEAIALFAVDGDGATISPATLVYEAGK